MQNNKNKFFFLDKIFTGISQTLISLTFLICEISFNSYDKCPPLVKTSDDGEFKYVSELFRHSPISHTCTVVRECFKGDEASQWKRPKFDPSPHQNPLTNLQRNWQAWLRPGRHTACKILYRSVQGFLFPKYVILPCFWGEVCFFGGGSSKSIRLQPVHRMYKY